MRRVIELVVAVLEGTKAIAGLVAYTLCVAFTAPIVVGFTLLLIALIPYYFWTLVTRPSWLHLYFAVVFISVIVYLTTDTETASSPVRRGRVVTRRPGGTSRARKSPSGPSARSKIRRVR